MPRWAKIAALFCVIAGHISAQPNKTPKSKDQSSCPKEPITLQIEHQEIARDAQRQTSTSPPRWYESPEWWLFIAAMGTLIAIVYQARESAKATQAMRDGIKLQSESLRPRLTIGARVSPFMDMVEGKKIIVDVDFINTGGTPAYGVLPETWLELLGIPFTSFTSTAVHQSGGKITVHPRQPSPFGIPFGRNLTPEEIMLAKSVKATLYLRIRLVYEAFGKGKYTDYTFQITPTTLNIENCDAD
jgi:hypothetical protein